MSFTYKELSDWVIEDNMFAFRYVKGTDPNEVANRVACIEKSPRVQVVDRFAVSRKGDTYATSDDSIAGVWIYGYKGIDCHDEESRQWCDTLLKALYPDD